MLQPHYEMVVTSPIFESSFTLQTTEQILEKSFKDAKRKTHLSGWEVECSEQGKNTFPKS